MNFWTLRGTSFDAITYDLFYLPGLVITYVLAIIATTIFTLIGYTGKLLTRGDSASVIFMILFVLPALYAYQSLGILLSPEALAMNIGMDKYSIITSSIYSATGTLYLAFTILGLGRANSATTRKPGILTALFSFLAMVVMGYTFINNPNSAMVHVSLLVAIPAFIGLLLIEKNFLFGDTMR